MRLAVSSFLITIVAATLVVVDGRALRAERNTAAEHAATLGDAAALGGRHVTNAKRLAMNLPPLKPKRLYSGTRVSQAPRSGVSLVPDYSLNCAILVYNTVGGAGRGYITAAMNSEGIYNGLDRNGENALRVKISFSKDDPHPSELDVFASNSPQAEFPYFGAASPADGSTLGQGKASYAYITGTKQIPAGSPQSGDNNSYAQFSGDTAYAESAIWSVDARDRETQELRPQWINPDGTTPATQIVLVESTGTFALTSDIAEAQVALDSELTPVTFYCVTGQQKR